MRKEGDVRASIDGSGSDEPTRRRVSAKVGLYNIGASVSAVGPDISAVHALGEKANSTLTEDSLPTTSITRPR